MSDFGGAILKGYEPHTDQLTQQGGDPFYKYMKVSTYLT